MNLILTSDFPSTGSEIVLERMRSVATNPTIAWISPFADDERFMRAQEQFGLHGFDGLEYWHIGKADHEQVDILY